LRGDASPRFLEVRPEAEHPQRPRHVQRSLGTLQALAERRNAVQDVVGPGVELVFSSEFTLRQDHPLFVAFPKMPLAPSFIPLTAPRVAALLPACRLRPRPCRRRAARASR
jgi:hypothetical protein